MLLAAQQAKRLSPSSFTKFVCNEIFFSAASLSWWIRLSSVCQIIFHNVTFATHRWIQNNTVNGFIYCSHELQCKTNKAQQIYTREISSFEWILLDLLEMFENCSAERKTRNRIVSLVAKVFSISSFIFVIQLVEVAPRWWFISYLIHLFLSHF